MANKSSYHSRVLVKMRPANLAKKLRVVKGRVVQIATSIPGCLDSMIAIFGSYLRRMRYLWNGNVDIEYLRTFRY